MIEVRADNEIVDYDETKKLMCGRCTAGIYKAKVRSDGREIYVHRTSNGFANHAMHCPHKKYEGKS